MATDCLALMHALGHDQFAVVGHDRGGYVALRLALDHPEAVTRLAFLGTVPIGEALARVNAKFATSWWHWFFFARPDEPERMICADPDAFYRIDRAGLGIDRAHDDADRASGRTVACPTLVLWSAHDDDGELYPDILDIWRTWAPDLSGGPFGSGHHMAEENPDQLARTLRAFLDAVGSLACFP
jgi:haloacetate dehalogenase